MPELGIVGWDVPSIVILTLHLLWRELITEDEFIKSHTYLYTYLGTIFEELVLTNQLKRVN